MNKNTSMQKEKKEKKKQIEKKLNEKERTTRRRIHRNILFKKHREVEDDEMKIGKGYVIGQEPDEVLFSEGEENLLLKTHAAISIQKDDKKVLLARTKMVEPVTDVIIEWLSGTSETLKQFMVRSYSYAEHIIHKRPFDVLLAEHMAAYDANDVGFKELLYYPAYRLFTFTTLPLKYPILPTDTEEEKIEKISNLTFIINFDSNSCTRFFSFPDYKHYIPDNVKHAIKIKILLDNLVLGTSFSEPQLFKCDFFLNRTNNEILHKDSSLYGPAGNMDTGILTDNVEYVSLLTLCEDPSRVIRGTQLMVDDLNEAQPIANKAFVGLPASNGSNILFYDPIFIHATPSKELPSSNEIITGVVESTKKDYSFIKAKSLSLPPAVKEKIIQGLSLPRRFLRCHYMPLLRSLHQPHYHVFARLDDTIAVRITNEDIKHQLIEYTDTTLHSHSFIKPNRTSIVSTTNTLFELNEKLHSLIVHNMTLGGKRKTQKHYKQTHTTQNPKFKTKKHIKKIVNLKYKFKLPENNSVVIDINQNLKNGIIYCKNQDIYKVLKCYTGNTIIY